MEGVDGAGPLVGELRAFSASFWATDGPTRCSGGAHDVGTAARYGEAPGWALAVHDAARCRDGGEVPD